MADVRVDAAQRRDLTILPRVGQCEWRGGDNPTKETPPYLIESTVKFVHDEGMEQLVNLPVEALLDPVVFAPAIAVSAALFSGLAARLVEFCQDHLPTHRSSWSGHSTGRSS
jgi:hypothetical protein